METENKNGYQSRWEAQLQETLRKILNREKFSYDLSGDALYRQYQDRYTRQGQQAMMDTMGQSAALTGGYGNSYAQTAAQQTYQSYLQQLGDRVPELYKIALDTYNGEGSRLRDNLSVLTQQEEQDYGRYRDRIADQNSAYSKLMALIKGYHYEPTAEELEAAGMTVRQKNAILKPYYDALEAASASSGGGGGGGGMAGYDTKKVRQVQKMLNKNGWNVAVDGIFGEETRKAYAQFNKKRMAGDS